MRLRPDEETRLGECPNLVGVAVGAAPDLHDVAVAGAAVGEVEALACVKTGEWVLKPSEEFRPTLVLERNALVTGVEPRLSGKAGEALPDLHLGTISGTCRCIM